MMDLKVLPDPWKSWSWSSVRGLTTTNNKKYKMREVQFSASRELSLLRCFRRELLHELFAQFWVPLYQVGAFTSAIVQTIVITMHKIVHTIVHAIVYA